MSTENSGQPHPETRIVIEGQKTVVVRKSALSAIMVYIVEVVFALSPIAGFGYVLLTFHPKWQQRARL